MEHCEPLRQEQKLDFQVCSGELIDLVDRCLPVWEDLVCALCTSVVGVPTAVCVKLRFCCRKKVSR